MLNETIQHTIASYTTSEDHKKRPHSPGLLDVEAFIDHLNYNEYSHEDLTTIEILCKKIDVSKKLYTSYDLTSLKPQSTAEISSRHFNLLFCHLIGVWLYRHNFKCINTALKMNASIMHNAELRLSEKSKHLIHMVTKNVFANA